MPVITQTPVTTTIGCEYTLTDFYTCGSPSTYLVTATDWEMYLCPDCHSTFNA